MAATRVVRLYKPSGRRAQCAHWSPAAMAEGGLTLCGLSTRGMAGWSPPEHELARRLRICADCRAVAHGAPPLQRHPAMVGG